MTKLIELNGIDHKAASRLGKMGIDSAETLLKRGHTPQARTQLAQKTLISSRRLLTWVQLADLLRINGIGCDYAILLNQVGVKTVTELGQSEASSLRIKLDQINRRRRTVKRVPAVSRIETWISSAQQLHTLVEA